MDMDITLPTMITVVDVQFKTGGKSYSFDPGEATYTAGQEVIIDTQRGLEFGICQRGNHNVLSDQVVQPLRPVVRLADDADRQRLADNAVRETQAFDTCQFLIERLALDMKLVRVECAFDGSKLLFFFTSDGRVDFRELVKELASVYRTRIEMRQIGVRDEAKLLGGLGICGRPFCCAQFLDDFQPVSIKMAKTQNLSLNPTKISGTCGRLMCCLKYEQDAYEDLIKTSPRQGSLVDTVDGRGTVTDVSLLRQQVKVSLEETPNSAKYYRNEDIAVLRDGKGKKTDPPIPPEIAPISGDPERRAKLRSSAQPEPDLSDLPALKFFGDFEEPQPEPKPQRRRKSKPADPEKPVEKEPDGHREGNRSRNRRRKPKPAEGQPNAAPTEPRSERPRSEQPRPEGGQRHRRPQKQNAAQNAAPKAESAPQSDEKSAQSKPNHRRRRTHRGSRGGHGGQKPSASGES